MYKYLKKLIHNNKDCRDRSAGETKHRKKIVVLLVQKINKVMNTLV